MAETKTKIKSIKLRSPGKRRRLLRRRRQYRPPKGYLQKMGAIGDTLLAQANEMWEKNNPDLDTSVRDNLAYGLAYLLYVAFDCKAISLSLTLEEWNQYHERQVFDWYHSRGFALWFCMGASNLFRKSRPRFCSGIDDLL